MAYYFGPITKDATDVFNYCTKYLVRDRSNDETMGEGWRFPLVATVLQGDNAQTSLFNEVTFIYHNKDKINIDRIELVGSFLPLYKSMPLTPVKYDNEDTDFFYLTLIIPIGKGFYYRFRINGTDVLDPINPQKITLNNGKEWSFFFTDYFNNSTEFEGWEFNLLSRLVEQIVPFRTEEAQNFINRFYDNLDHAQKEQMPIYRLDQSVGEVNYIANILAREERHHLIDYKICIDIIDKLLRKRNPVVNSWQVSAEEINRLYNDMANADNTPVPDWDYSRYGDPQYFLKLLRRHCIVGAFSHPRYGGNVGCAGWNYLKEKYCIKDPDTGLITGSYFNWDLAIERPLGKNVDYRG